MTSELKFIPLASIDIPKVKLREVQATNPAFPDLLLSIQAHGILDPLLVKPNPKDQDRYILANGLQRYACAERLGLKEVPVHIKDLGDEEDTLLAAMIANLHKIDTPPYEYAKAMRRIVRKRPHLTLEDMGRMMGKSGPWVRERLSLLKLTEEVGTLVDDGVIPLKAAYGLTLLKPEDQKELAPQVKLLPSDDFYQKCVETSRAKMTNPHASSGFEEFAVTSTLRRKKDIEEELELQREFYTRQNMDSMPQDPLEVWQLALSWCLHLDQWSIAKRKETYERRMKKLHEAKEESRIKNAQNISERVESTNDK